MFTNVIDKILEGNLFAVATAFMVDKVGIINIQNSTTSLSRESVLQNALLISAVTGAIYGVYRIIDLIIKGCKSISKKFKSNKTKK